MCYARAPLQFSPDKHFSEAISLFSRFEEIMERDFSDVEQLKKDILGCKDIGCKKKDTCSEEVVKKYIKEVMNIIRVQGSSRLEKGLVCVLQKDKFLRDGKHFFKAIKMLFEEFPKEVMCFFHKGEIRIEMLFR